MSLNVQTPGVFDGPEEGMALRRDALGSDFETKVVVGGLFGLAFRVGTIHFLGLLPISRGGNEGIFTLHRTGTSGPLAR